MSKTSEVETMETYGRRIFSEEEASKAMKRGDTLRWVRIFRPRRRYERIKKYEAERDRAILGARSAKPLR